MYLARKDDNISWLDFCSACDRPADGDFASNCRSRMRKNAETRRNEEAALAANPVALDGNCGSEAVTATAALLTASSSTARRIPTPEAGVA